MGMVPIVDRKSRKQRDNCPERGEGKIQNNVLRLYACVFCVSAEPYCDNGDIDFFEVVSLANVFTCWKEHGGERYQFRGFLSFIMEC